jgi:hypothetical protein
MAPIQLKCGNLAGGDILLKLSDGSPVSRAISFGQGLVGQLNQKIVHAGVLSDSTHMIEAQGTGVSENDLRGQNKRYGYLVFRCTNANLANGAGTFAKILFDVHKRGGNLSYAPVGALGSLAGPGGKAATRGAMDDMMDRVLAGRSHPFFCSQLVVMVFQFAAEQNGINASSLFRDDDRTVSPSTLASRLNGHGMFREVGYLMANER